MPDQVDWRATEREASPGRAVGRLLRDQREARGLSVVDIEKRLRFRRSHIEAIEAGRFDLLPGAAYIPAFLRSYASHLGLDAEKVMNAYQSSGPVPIKRPIALPADFPLVEKRAPIGLAVLTVLLVVGAGYAVWHYLPRQQSVVAEKVPPVPDRLLATLPSPSSSESAKPVIAGGAPQPAQTLPNGLPVETWPASRQEATRQDAASAPAAQTAPQPAPPIVVTVPAPPPPVVMSAPTVGQAQAAQPVEPIVQEARPAPAEPVNPVVAVPASLPTRVDTPLLVRTNSWVELRAPNGDILAMTYVRAGETYTVPAGIAYRIIDAR